MEDAPKIVFTSKKSVDSINVNEGLYFIFSSLGYLFSITLFRLRFNFTIKIR